MTLIAELDALSALARGPYRDAGNVGVVLTIDRRATKRGASVHLWIGLQGGAWREVEANTLDEALARGRRVIETFNAAEAAPSCD